MAIKDQSKYAEYERVRQIFFTDGERKRFYNGLKNPKDRNIHFLLRELDPTFLFKKATELMNQVEAGQFNREEMYDVEYKIAHYLAAMNLGDKNAEGSFDIKDILHKYEGKSDVEIAQLQEKEYESKLRVVEGLIKLNNKSRDVEEENYLKQLKQDSSQLGE